MSAGVGGGEGVGGGGAGVAGPTGPTGPTGPAASTGTIPSSFVAVTTPVTGLNSGTWADVAGATTTITTTATVPIVAWITVYWSGASSLIVEFRAVIDAQNSDPTIVTGRATGGGQTAAVMFQSSALAAGTYTVKLQYQKDSGSGNISVDHVDLEVQAQQGPLGPTGPTGATGTVTYSSVQTALAAAAAATTTIAGPTTITNGAGSPTTLGQFTTSLPSLSGNGIYVPGTIVMGSSTNGLRLETHGNPGLAWTGNGDVQVKTGSDADLLLTLQTGQALITSWTRSSSDKPIVFAKDGEVTTSDNTLTVIGSVFAVTAGQVLEVMCVFIAKNGTSGWGVLRRRAVFYRGGGSLTQIGSTETIYTDQADGTLYSGAVLINAGIRATSNNIETTVTGVAATSITWGRVVEITYHAA